MKKYLFIFVTMLVSIASCKKEDGWDTPLNGIWTEVSNTNTRALPSNCDIVFENGKMILCNESIGEDLNKKSKVYASKGQIWISYKLSFRKHEEYRYDYEFDGSFLWIVEETSEKFYSVIGNPQAKKYRKK